ncbi:hypothetical protein Tsubulata_017741 [Turnera subulata]|uniref:Glutaredoxin domain-containing protein n=1 Tax=Turnera subulata TaxID=218843 RepID=A0A9Q0JQP6_9ROSI|nr:hypothetical protein Tsubulata_017741 [Turnera subulata]
MKGVKGKLLKRLKSIKPIGYLKPDRILQVNAADGFVEALPKIPFFKAQSQVVSKEPVQEKVKESCVLVDQEPEVIDVTELMRDLEEEEEEEEEEMEVEGEDMDDKENVRPRAEKGRDQIGVREKKELSLSSSRQTPLSEVDTLSFRRPDLNSGSLFDPNLLAAFEEAVKEHMRISEEERQARIERENIERRLQEAEKQGRILAENIGTQEEEEEPPLKARRIEKEEEEEEEEDDDDVDPLIRFPEKCPPGGSDSVVLYSTTLRGIRKTFEDCHSIRFLLESFRVVFFEKDVSMHTEFKEELWRVLDGKVMPPRLFIKGRYIGGAEEVLGLHEQGKLRVLFEGIPIDQSVGPCEGCAGVRFVLCSSCRGSHRVVADDGSSSQCQICNENGLVICPLCC